MGLGCNVSVCHGEKIFGKELLRQVENITINYCYYINNYSKLYVATWIAESCMELDQVRLLVLQAAQVIDSGGPKPAKKEVSYLLHLIN